MKWWERTLGVVGGLLGGIICGASFGLIAFGATFLNPVAGALIAEVGAVLTGRSLFEGIYQGYKHGFKAGLKAGTLAAPKLLANCVSKKKNPVKAAHRAQPNLTSSPDRPSLTMQRLLSEPRSLSPLNANTPKTPLNTPVNRDSKALLPTSYSWFAAKKIIGFSKNNTQEEQLRRRRSI